MFESARLKLTAQYLAIIMAISLLFSIAIYTRVTSEFGRFERMQVRIQDELKEEKVPSIPNRNLVFRVGRPDPAIIQDARKRIVVALAGINIAIFLFSGAAGYFLAGKTLRPIKKMVDEQHRFITDASHELRTPLTSLRTGLEVELREKKISPQRTKKLLENALEDVIGLQSLSERLLELAQNGYLVDPALMTKTSLSFLVEQAVKKVQPLADVKKINIKQNVKNIPLICVSDRLVEVFIILLDNAIKYSKGGTTVIINSKKIKDHVLIQVVDQGVGISKESLFHIFDRFYRVDSSRSDVKGYGLGLSIAKKIVSSHGGEISVKSELGKGTTFTILLNTSSS
ncbi:MAG: hypothetical protein HZC02_00695 [Candidatus Levybacteria bacterium]|nr:hypothetical protein [Candidatus Levybacteria bacterium]